MTRIKNWKSIKLLPEWVKDIPFAVLFIMAFWVFSLGLTTLYN